MFAFRDTKQKKRFFLFENLDFVNKVLPAILLIFAIMLFRRKIDRLRERTFFSREKLMRFHTVIFLVFFFWLPWQSDLADCLLKCRRGVYSIVSASHFRVLLLVAYQGGQHCDDRSFYLHVRDVLKATDWLLGELPPHLQE